MDKDTRKRTKAQNDSFHSWLEEIAEICTEQGITLPMLLEKLTTIQVWVTKDSLKTSLIHPYIIQAFGKDGTSKLDTREFNKTIEAFNEWIGREFHIHVPFPSRDQQNFEEHYN